MPIVAEGVLNYNSLQVDDLYVVLIPPQTPLIQGYPTDGIGFVGIATWGPLNTPIPFGDIGSALRNYGNLTTHANDLITEAIGALKQGANNLYGVRVSDGSDLASTVLVKDSAGNNILTLSGLYTGTEGDSIRGVISPGSNSTAVAATGTITLSGTVTAADTITATIATIATVYTAVAGDTLNSAAVGLAAKINANASVNTKVVATVNGAVITITALNKGTVGNSVGLTTSKTGTVVSTASGANLTLGAGTQTFRLLLTHPNFPAEIFDNIPGIAGIAVTTATSISSANTVATNILVALASGQSGIRGPSSIARGSVPGTSPGSADMVNQNLTFAGGANGTAGVNTNVMVGIDGTVRTGMYALRSLPIIQFGLAGVTDTTSWALQQAFALSENCMCVTAFVVGASPTAAVNSKNAAAMDTPFMCFVKDFLYLNDTKNNVIRLVSPIGPTLGKLATSSPEQSPGNKPIYGYLGTEKTGYEGPGGSFLPGAPYSYADMALMESNGVLFYARPSVGGNYLALRHGQNASSDPTRNQIPYTRTAIFITESLNQSLGFAVNLPHTPELRRRVKASCAAFLESLANPGAGRSGMIGDVNGGKCYSILLDKTNNPDAQVALGYMFLDIQVKFWSTVRFFVVRVEAGASVTVREGNSVNFNTAA